MQTLPTSKMDGDTTTFFFVSRENFLSMGKLQTWSEMTFELLREEWSWQDVLAPSKDVLAEYLIISHRWVRADDADPTGKQYEAIKQYVGTHTKVKKIWADVCCLPQGHRNRAEQEYFRSTLQNVNILYVGFTVCFLLDLSVMSRFWCVLEYFLGTRLIEESGIGASQKRMEVVYLSNDPESDEMLRNFMNRTMGRTLEHCLEHLDREERPRGHSIPLRILFSL